MAIGKEEVRKELEASVKQGNELFNMLREKNQFTEFGTNYQGWYTRALPLVRALAPDRLSEFRAYYEADLKRKTVNVISYVLQDFVNGIAPAPDVFSKAAYDHYGVAMAKMLNQVRILASLGSRIESVLANVDGNLLAEIEDRELAAAADLSKTNLRAAGTLVGVVLERHLGQVATNRGIKLGKKDPTIGDFNEALKKEEVYDLPTYRKVQYFADLRNICCHNKGRDPTFGEVQELLGGVGGIIKTVF